MAYCEKEDLLTGDIPLAGKYGDGSSFCSFAADEIDAQIGHIYVTPLEFPTAPPASPAEVAKARPATLLIKKINILLASGRIILDMAAGGEDDALHAYGKSMRDEAIELLTMISSGKIDLYGATLLEDRSDDENTAVSIKQEDPYSLVEGFYTGYNGSAGSAPVYPMRPYDDLDRVSDVG